MWPVKVPIAIRIKDVPLMHPFVLKKQTDDDIWQVNRGTSNGSLDETPTSNNISAIPSPNTVDQKINSQLDSVDALRDTCWHGIPSPMRATAWPILLGIIHGNKEKRDAQIKQKTKSYVELRQLTLDEPRDEAAWHQIEIDVPRTNPSVPLFSKTSTQQALLRILYCLLYTSPSPRD